MRGPGQHHASRGLRIGTAMLAGVSLWALNGCGRPNSDEELNPETSTDFHVLFGTHCAGCHGADGSHGPGPHISDPVYLAFAKPETISQVIKNGRLGTPMPSFGAAAGGPLSDQQVDALVQGMIHEWSKPSAVSGAKIPPYSEQDAIAQGEEAGNSERGQKAYMFYCSPCHGTGTGKSLVGPMAVPSYLAIASDQLLRTTIVIGRTDFGMPDWRHRPPRMITSQDISDVVAYLRSKRPAYSKVQQAGAAVQQPATTATAKTSAAGSNPAGREQHP